MYQWCIITCGHSANKYSIRMKYKNPLKHQEYQVHNTNMPCYNFINVLLLLCSVCLLRLLIFRPDFSAIQLSLNALMVFESQMVCLFKIVLPFSGGWDFSMVSFCNRLHGLSVSYKAISINWTTQQSLLFFLSSLCVDVLLFSHHYKYHHNNRVPYITV